MATLTVKQDQHGLYIITNGGVYRPQPGRYSEHHPKLNGQTQHKAGDKVKGGHISQSSLARVGGEIWGWHGPSPEMAKSLSKVPITGKIPPAWDPRP